MFGFGTCRFDFKGKAGSIPSCVISNALIIRVTNVCSARSAWFLRRSHQKAKAQRKASKVKIQRHKARERRGPREEAMPPVSGVGRMYIVLSLVSFCCGVALPGRSEEHALCCTMPETAGRLMRPPQEARARPDRRGVPGGICSPCLGRKRQPNLRRKTCHSYLNSPVTTPSGSEDFTYIYQTDT